MSQGWGSVSKLEQTEDDGAQLCTAHVLLSKYYQRERINSDEVFKRDVAKVLERVLSVAEKHGWYAAKDKAPNPTKQEAVNGSSADQVYEVKIPEDYMSFFSHIYARDAQIRLIRDSIAAAAATKFQKRTHCVLWGLPGCGKTEILLAFERMIGAQNFIKLDATMTTKAGAENFILDIQSVPPIIIIEEIEKCNPVNLPWLLGVMDDRGEIIKTNARIGSVRKEARCLILATANDYDEFKKMYSGALASRFKRDIYCPRPNKEILRMILAREVKEINGDPRWIQPAIDYALSVRETDPRRVMALLDGRDRLLTGEYQADLTTIRDEMEADADMFTESNVLQGVQSDMAAAELAQNTRDENALMDELVEVVA